MLSAAELRGRLSAGLDAPAGSETARPGIAAAVLVPIVLDREPGVVLTKRTGHLSSHAGQVSLPGGRIDPEDAGPEAAALREAWEEIGLSPDRVELAGRLPDRLSSTGYRVTPVVGLIEAPGPLRPSAHEVAAVFVLPMAVLLDPAAPRRGRIRMGEGWHDSWIWPHAEHEIWGLTASILVSLATRLRRGR